MNANDGGTPQDSAPDTGNGGTGSGAGDGTGGRSPSKEDLQALERVHRENLEKARAELANKEARIAALEARVMAATAPPADSAMRDIQELQERASYDDNARAILAVKTELVVTQLENRLSNDIMALGVPREHIPTVQGLVRQSQYTMSAADAARLARGTVVDSVEAQNKKLAEENERLKKEMESVRTRVPNMAMSPIAAVEAGASSIPSSTYNAILERGGHEADALMKRVNSKRGTPGHIELEYGK